MTKRTVVVATALLVAGLAGCATPEAGRATSPVDARLTIEWPRIALDGNTMPNVTVTATQTITITPTSEATQTTTQDVKPSLEVPASLLPK